MEHCRASGRKADRPLQRRGSFRRVEQQRLTIGTPTGQPLHPRHRQLGAGSISLAMRAGRPSDAERGRRSDFAAAGRRPPVALVAICGSIAAMRRDARFHDLARLWGASMQLGHG
jgi:hypothetical protein